MAINNKDFIIGTVKNVQIEFCFEVAVIKSVFNSSSHNRNIQILHTKQPLKIEFKFKFWRKIVQFN